MARDDDDDDSLAPLGENTEKFLDHAKKGQARSFLLVCKGNKVNYLAVKKKPVKKNELNEAKKSGYKGEGYFGVITGKGMELVFNLSTADGYTAEPVKDKILKDFLAEKADFKCKPTIAIVATLPDIPFDEEDLKNPLVARFVALVEQIAQVLDINPSAEEELKQTSSEIRGLLQDADFNSAEPRVNTLEARLQELLEGAAANSPAPGAPNAPATSATVQPSPPTTPTTPSVDNDVLKLKLQEALNKLVPQLKQAVATYPEKKVELLTPVAQIKKQLDSGELQEAKKVILAVSQLLNSLKAADTGPSADQLLAGMKKLSPAIKQAVADHPDRKAEILKPVAAFQTHVKAGELPQANEALLQVGALLNSLKTESAELQDQASTDDVAATDGLSIVKLGKARLEWANVRVQAGGEMKRLRAALEAGYKDDEEQQTALAAALERIDAVAREFNENLENELDAVLSAQDANKRLDLSKIAKATMARFVSFLDNDEIMSALDGNDVLPDMQVTAPLRVKLREIAAALG